MKHKRYNRGGLRTTRSWTDQLLGMGLLAVALACYHLITHRTSLQNISMVATYLFGTGLIIFPIFNPKRLIKSLLISAIIIALAILLAFVAIRTSDHKPLTKPFTHKQVITPSP